MGIALGMVFLLGSLIFGPYTGACINPIVLIGANIVKGDFSYLIFYFVSSIFGCLFGGFYYKNFIMQTDSDYEEGAIFKDNMKTPQNINLAQNLKY